MSAPQTSAPAAAPAKPDVLVLGCGISGLSCGILLARLGHRVTIWAKELPPHTTSNAAAAVWWPYLSKSEKVGGWGQMSLHYYQHYMLPEPESGVMACFAKEVFVEKMGDDKIPAWAASFPSFRRLKPEEIPAGYVDGWGLESVVIHSDVALQYLVRKFRDQYKGTIVKREVKTPAEALNACPIVVNCTGLGSRALFNDQLLYPIRGQILRIRHTGFKPAIFDDHDPARGVCYVVPRQNDIVIGGTAQANNWDTKISKRDTEEIKRRAVRNFPELANMEVLEVKVGLRPGRSDIRVETEAFDGGKRIVVHNYGHGGSGWTVAWGCAMEVCQLINEALPSLQARSKL